MRSSDDLNKRIAIFNAKIVSLKQYRQFHPHSKVHKILSRYYERKLRKTIKALNSMRRRVVRQNRISNSKKDS